MKDENLASCDLGSGSTKGGKRMKQKQHGTRAGPRTSS